MDQQERARAFRALHTGPILVLPNAWDAGSARLIEQAGAKAIATTSAGVSWSRGVPDGQHLDADSAVAAVAAITAVVRVPVTADVEGGYAEDLRELVDVLRAVLATGAAGINLEDASPDGGGLRPVEEQCRRIAVVRQAAADAGIDLFLNARTDGYLIGAGSPDDRFGETVRRAAAYRDAGADGVFVPGIVDGPTIGELVRGIHLPVNVMAGPGAPDVGKLAELGVARVSLGTALALAAYGVARRAAAELLSAGRYPAPTDLGYGEFNSLLAEKL
jgi:2-methylisocitrate lyase-like PEP mutase family enzyme